MSTIKSQDENLTLNAHGSGNDIKFQSNGVEKASISDGGVMTATSFAGSGASLTSLPNGSQLDHSGTKKLETTANGVTISGGSSTAANLTITSTAADDNIAPDLILQRLSASPADNDNLGGLEWQGNHSGGSVTSYAQITCVANDVTDGTEDASLRFYTATNGSTSEKMRIDYGGNVGIGVVPEVWNSQLTGLQIGETGAISGGDTAWGGYLEVGSNFYRDSGGFKYTTADRASLIEFDNNAGEIKFKVTSASAGAADAAITWHTGMYLANNGSLVIMLDTGSEPNLTVYDTNNQSGDVALYTKLGSNCSNTSSYHIKSWNGLYGNVFKVYGNGNVVNKYNSYGQDSDEKLKENIVDATNKLDELNKVKVRNFNFIGDADNKQIGVIAQELESIFPSMITETADMESVPDADWIKPWDKTEADRPTKEVPLGTSTKSVKYSVFVPMLVKALQEATTKIETLEARITALES